MSPNKTRSPVLNPPPPHLMDTISSFRQPLLLTHINPDADALGSMLGMTLILRALGQSPTPAAPPNSINARLTFMAQRAAIDIHPDPAHVDADGIIALDTAKTDRLNAGTEFDSLLKGRQLVNIDHHTTNPSYGHVNWIDPTASSTAELVWRIGQATGFWSAHSATNSGTVNQPLTGISPVAAAATVLYAGILGDTVGFSLSSTAASALLAAASLVHHGADVGFVGRRLLRDVRPNEFALLQHVYRQTQTAANGKIAYSIISLEDLQQSGCLPADIDNQVDVPRSIAGSVLAILFSETRPGVVRVNLRSEPPFEALKLARRFNGGGHVYACGASIHGPLQQIVRDVLAAASEFVDSSV